MPGPRFVLFPGFPHSSCLARPLSLQVRLLHRSVLVGRFSLGKILFLTNNDVSQPLIDWLRESNDVLVHGEPLAPADMAKISPDIAISYSYRHIIRPAVLSLLNDRFFNLHVSLLPFNRGADPNAWSFLNDTPKGVTIHRLDAGLDTGPIVAQREVLFNEEECTLGSTYAVLQASIQDLFRQNWDAIACGEAPKYHQMQGGTHHNSREFAAIRAELMGKEGWSVPIPLFKARYASLVSRMKA